MSRVQPGDTIVVAFLDRVSRKFDEGVCIQAELTGRNIGIVAIQENIDTNERRAAAKFFRHSMAQGAYQVNSARDRIKLGQDRSKAGGERIGRPPALTPVQVEHCRRMAEEGTGCATWPGFDGLLTGDGAEGAGRNLSAGGTIVNWLGAEKRPDLRHHMPTRPWKNETATVLPAWENMNDQQLDRNLRSVGREVFVAYFTDFCDRSRSNEDVAAQIEEERGYTDKSCRSRTSHARSIIWAGRATDALVMVSCSTSPRVPSQIKKKASGLARERSGLL